MSDAPTRARYTVVTFAVLLAIITYIDRVCISQAAPAMQEELGISKIQMGWAFSVFGWAYALFEVPGGWLGDKLGPRRVLMRVVVWWSIFTAATGWVWNVTSLLITRTLFGAGEAGCFPNVTRVFTTWLPSRDRERAQATLWLSARWGGALTPLLVMWVLTYVSWRRAFEIFGVVGVVWAIAFYRWYRDDPSTHPSVNKAELALLPAPRETEIGHAVPWRLILRKPSVWLLCAQYACLSYGWYFYITWLPTYLREARGTAATGGLLDNPIWRAVFAGIPLLLGGVGNIVSASLSKPLARKTGSVILSRRIQAITGFTGASLCVIIFTRIADPVTGMFVLGLASFFNDFVMPPSWAGCMDIGGRYSGSVSGTMNMAGNIAGAISPIAVAYLLSWTQQNWTVTFYVSAAIYFLGAICWLFIDARTPLEEKGDFGVRTSGVLGSEPLKSWR